MLEVWHKSLSPSQRYLQCSGVLWRRMRIISSTVSTLEGGGSIMLPAFCPLHTILFARAYTSARSIGFCIVSVCKFVLVRLRYGYEQSLATRSTSLHKP